jgi:hypothetical protein
MNALGKLTVAVGGAALALVAAVTSCEPPRRGYQSHCNVTFDGTDVAGYQRTENTLVAAFSQCDVEMPTDDGGVAPMTPHDACAALLGWHVISLPASETVPMYPPLGDAGLRAWHPDPATMQQAGAEGISLDGGAARIWIRGLTDCFVPYEDGGQPTITLSDEHWWQGAANSELIHAITRECMGGNPYAAWPSNGRGCVFATAKAALADAGR